MLGPNFLPYIKLLHLMVENQVLVAKVILMSYHVHNRPSLTKDVPG